MTLSFHTRAWPWLLGCGLVLLLVATVTAQTQFGTITGRVVDGTGAVVVGADVTLTDNATEVSKSAATGADGVYSFAAITPSTYNLAVSKQGFATIQKGLVINPADRLTEDFTLEVGSEKTTVTVEANTVTVNTTTGDVSHVITTQDLQNIPLLTKNPYALIGLSAGAADSTATGDTRGGGFAVNGQRTSSLNFLLDGTENNETFATGPAALVPNDAVQEFKVQGNNMTSEFGRNAAVTNVVTKSGTNTFHGSASEYWRGAAITANTVQNKQNDVKRPGFTRNDFTFTAGGPIIKDKMFYFGALEGVRVRSAGNNFWWVPTQDFLNVTSPQMAGYLKVGGLPSSNANNCITTGQFANANQGEGGPPTLLDQNGDPIPLSTPLFCQVVTSVPIDAGGGLGQNTWNALGKIDHRLSNNTGLSFRFAFTNNDYPVGAGADSPYPTFRAPYYFTSSNYAATFTHAFSSSMVNETRIGFSRTEPNAPNGTASPLIPCIQFGNRNATPDGFPIAFPGYLPTICNYSSLRSGGPQNTISAGTGFTKVWKKHIFKWGAYFSHLRDNHTFGAYENASGSISDPQNLINGLVDTRYSVAIDPKGMVPGDIYDPGVNGPFAAPNFSRHYRYNEVGLYGEDAIRITNRFTLTLGMRWEYFGVLHSPDAERSLDANFLLDAVGQPKALDPSKTVFEQIRDGRFQRVNNFFNQNWKNFGPRLGFAWDLFGNGSTAIRGGYGIFYDKNFGNALFNAIQNPPNYNVAALSGFTPAYVDANEYVLLTNIVGTGAAPIGGSARMLNRDMKTAYSQQWNVGIEHDIMRKGLIASAQYIGTKGDHLYSLNNLNQLGSCILAPPGSLAVCDPTGDSGTIATRINQTGVTGLNRRANEGFSRYNSIRAGIKTRPLHGITLDGSYTYAVWKDNASSFFADASFDANWGFGFRNPFNPALDYAPSTNDIRHRFVMAYNWELPFAQYYSGAAKHILGGWTLSGVYSAQTGGAFSVYDAGNGDNWCAISGTNFCYPLAATTPKSHLQYSGANSFNYYDLTGYQSQISYCNGDLACTAYLELTQPQLLAKRNALRLPGIWNFDAALAKKFKVAERFGLEFHVEALNLFNHSNLYGNPATNDISNGFFQVTRGVLPGAAVGASGVGVERRSLQLGVKVNF